VTEVIDPEWLAFLSGVCDLPAHDVRGLAQAAENRVAFAAMITDIDPEALQHFDETWPLPFNPTYGTLTGQDLSKTAPALFERIKTALRRRGEGQDCWACGAPWHPSESRFGAHEFWKWRDSEGLRSLSAIHFLCKDCHYLVHHAYWLFVMVPDKAAATRVGKYMRVNQCTFIEAYAHAAWALGNARRRSKKEWTIDITPILDLVANDAEGPRPR
jgi:hypothetical protein